MTDLALTIPAIAWPSFTTMLRGGPSVGVRSQPEPPADDDFADEDPVIPDEAFLPEDDDSDDITDF